MFTGIVRSIGTIKAVEKRKASQRLLIDCPLVTKIHAKIGDSLAVNGICLTITKLQETAFAVDVMPETIRRTNLSTVRVGSQVNIEPALRASDRLDGHFVLGHVDTIGTVTSHQVEGNATVYQIRFPKKYRPLIIEKGSIAVDGVSLTVTQVSDNTFSVSLIPHTLQETILKDLNDGEVVNLETDILGKYILSGREAETNEQVKTGY